MLSIWRSLAGLIPSTARTHRPARKLVGGFGLAALAVGSALMMATPAISASAKGDVWTQPFNQGEETPKGHSQEVHLPCNSVDIWGDKLDAVTGQDWTLFHLPPPNPPGPGTVVATGTYSTDGSRQKIGVIDKSVFLGAPGPHFKIEVYNNGDKKSKTFWVECGPVQPSLSTVPDPETAVVGDLLKDSATIEGNIPTGTITFTLYNPSNTAVHTEAVAVNDDGTYWTPQGHIADVAGAWHWTAAYGGDDHNKVATSLDEPVTVNKADPSLSTAQDPAEGLVGTTLQDSAQLTEGYHPTGSITFHLLDPNGTDVHHETVAVDGNGSYATSHGFVANAAGTWQWWAEYSGDSNNDARHTQVGAEPVLITSESVTPTITTTPDPATAKVGDVLKDTATLGGTIDATGQITFELFDPNGHSAFHVTVDVSKYHSVYTTPTGFIAYAPGTWYWVASYSGDELNEPVASGAHDEPVTVEKLTPTITTTQDPTSGTAGTTTLQDSATLTGYHPTGTITFHLLNPGGTDVYHETVNVTSGSATYSTTHGFVPTTTGTWQWWAEYSGDDNNYARHTIVGEEPVIIREEGSQPVTPTISTTPIPTSAAIHARLKDSATLAGGDDPTGTIVFTLYRPNGVAAYTETVTVDGNGTYTTPIGFISDVGGTWHWKAAYSGDLNNNPVASDPADEPVVVAIGGVLAETAQTTPLQAMALGLLVFGLMAMLAGGVLAWRRRAA
jgi:hypothetical protein